MDGSRRRWHRWVQEARGTRGGSNFNRRLSSLSTWQRNCDSEPADEEVPALLRMRTAAEPNTQLPIRADRANVQRAFVTELVRRHRRDVWGLGSVDRPFYELPCRCFIASGIETCRPENWKIALGRGQNQRGSTWYLYCKRLLKQWFKSLLL